MTKKNEVEKTKEKIEVITASLDGCPIGKPCKWCNKRTEQLLSLIDEEKGKKIEELDNIWRGEAIKVEDILLNWVKDKKITRTDYYDLKRAYIPEMVAYSDYQLAINSIRHKVYMRIKRYICGLFKHKGLSEETNCSRCGYPYSSY